MSDSPYVLVEHNCSYKYNHMNFQKGNSVRQTEDVRLNLPYLCESTNSYKNTQPTGE